MDIQRENSWVTMEKKEMRDWKNENVLLTGFSGTSSEMLVQKAGDQPVILPNDKIRDSQIVLEELKRGSYDYLISFGQKPNSKDKIYIETTAREAGHYCNTNFDVLKLRQALEKEHITVQISNNAGCSFCNTLYWNVLNYIIQYKLGVKMIFLHIPFYKNISDPRDFFERILAAIGGCTGSAVGDAPPAG